MWNRVERSAGYNGSSLVEVGDLVAPLGDCWGTAGAPLGHSWGTVGGPLGDLGWTVEDP